MIILSPQRPRTLIAELAKLPIASLASIGTCRGIESNHAEKHRRVSPSRAVNSCCFGERGECAVDSKRKPDQVNSLRHAGQAWTIFNTTVE
jgi:hypothetical protein